MRVWVTVLLIGACGQSHTPRDADSDRTGVVSDADTVEDATSDTRADVPRDVETDVAVNSGIPDAAPDVCIAACGGRTCGPDFCGGLCEDRTTVDPWEIELTAFGDSGAELDWFDVSVPDLDAWSTSVALVGDGIRTVRLTRGPDVVGTLFVDAIEWE